MPLRLSLKPGLHKNSLYAGNLPHQASSLPSVLQAKLVAQIHFLDLLVGQYIVRVARGNDVAATDNVGILADIEGLPHIMVGDQHADALVPQVPDDLFDVAH